MNPSRLLKLLLALVATGLSGSAPAAVPAGAPTFNRDIAPILFAHCAPCHHPGQAAPFSLLSFDDAKRKAKTFAEVTQSRSMPPWLAEKGAVEFHGQRGLSEAQIDVIQKWVAAGTPEGEAKDLPPKPRFSGEWFLGKPDLIVETTGSYALPADGPDVYRHFVIPIPGDAVRQVRAVELLPDNPRVVHHAVMLVDRTSSARQLDARDPEPGFSGFMSAGQAQLPDGHFLGWTPGKIPVPLPPELCWRLDPGSDLVLQLHLKKTGKPETIRAKVGLFFSDKPATRRTYAVVLRDKDVVLPAGSTNVIARSQYTVPVDADLLSLYPHAHFLAREMEIELKRPDGSVQRLMRIPDWDFNWQDEYRLKSPLRIAAGSSFSFRYRFDNSATNPRNPNKPPRAIVYGRNASDEMAELLLQLLPARDGDLPKLRTDYGLWSIRAELKRYEKLALERPTDTAVLKQLANWQQQAGTTAEAVETLRRVKAMEPESGEARFLLGNACEIAGRHDEAIEEFTASIRFSAQRPEPLVRLARLLAAHPDPKKRQPAKALELAEQAMELTNGRSFDAAESFLLALASNARWDEAIDGTRQSIASATGAKLPEVAAMLGKRLKQFEARQLRLLVDP